VTPKLISDLVLKFAAYCGQPSYNVISMVGARIDRFAGSEVYRLTNLEFVFCHLSIGGLSSPSHSDYAAEALTVPLATFIDAS
jgi:hypothetical protein